MSIVEVVEGSEVAGDGIGAVALIVVLVCWSSWIKDLDRRQRRFLS